MEVEQIREASAKKKKLDEKWRIEFKRRVDFDGGSHKAYIEINSKLELFKYENDPWKMIDDLLEYIDGEDDRYDERVDEALREYPLEF